MLGQGLLVGQDIRKNRVNLHAAATSGNLSQVKQAVQHYSEDALDINTPDANACTPLDLAIQHQHIAVVDYLVSLPDIGINYNENPDKRTPLHTAILHHDPNKDKDLRILKAILSKSDHNILMPDSKWRTAYQYARSLGKEGLAKLILLKGREAREQANADKKYTDFHVACYLGEVEKVKSFQRNTQTLNAIDVGGVTPLFVTLMGAKNKPVANREGHAAIVQYLLEFPDILLNQGTLTNQTPLYGLVLSGDLLLLDLLLKHPHINVNPVESEIGRTPLHYAACAGLKSVVTALLTHAMILTDIKDKEGNTPEDLAYGVAQDIEGKTSEELARKARYLEIVQMLKAHKLKKTMGDGVASPAIAHVAAKPPVANQFILEKAQSQTTTNNNAPGANTNITHGQPAAGNGSKVDAAKLN